MDSPERDPKSAEPAAERPASADRPELEPVEVPPAPLAPAKATPLRFSSLKLVAALAFLVPLFLLWPSQSFVGTFLRALVAFGAATIVDLAVARNTRDGKIGNVPVKSLVLVSGLVVVTGTIAAVVLSSFGDATVYAKGVDQLLAEKQRWIGRNVRVEGVLVRGTLKFRESPCEYEFDATKGGQTLHVRYPSCIKPDTLRDDMPDVGVTAEGRLLENGEFQATNVLAKCPSKYEMKDKAPHPGGAPSTGAGPASLAP